MSKFVYKRGHPSDMQKYGNPYLSYSILAPFSLCNALTLYVFMPWIRLCLGWLNTEIRPSFCRTTVIFTQMRLSSSSQPHCCVCSAHSLWWNPSICATVRPDSTEKSDMSAVNFCFKANSEQAGIIVVLSAKKKTKTDRCTRKSTTKMMQKWPWAHHVVLNDL